MATDRRNSAATAAVGAAGVAAGGVLQHRGVKAAVGTGSYPKIHPTVFRTTKIGRGRYAAGSVLGLLSAVPLAAGTVGLVRPVSKKDDRSLLQEGLSGSASALRSRGESLRVKQPKDVRATQLAVATGAGLGGGRLARLALKRHPGLKPALGPVAGVLAATASLPLSNKLVQRKHPEYTVTATGVKRAKKPIKMPSSTARQVDPRNGSFRSQVVPSDFRKDDYLGRRTSYKTQRAAVTGAGGIPVVGIGTGAAAAARYAPPGQQRKAAARQAAYGPVAGTGAGLAGAYGSALAARHSQAIGTRAMEGLKAKHDFTQSVRGAFGLKTSEYSPAQETGRAMTVLRANKYTRPLAHNKSTLAAATVGGLAARAATTFAGGQKAISANQRDQDVYNTRHHLSKSWRRNRDEKHVQANRKRRQATLSTVGGVTGLTSLGLLAAGKKSAATSAGVIGGGIGGVNALYGARVGRKEATSLDPFKKSLPTHAVHRSFGKVRVLEQHSKDHFMVLTNRDDKRLVHRNSLTFTNKGEIGKWDRGQTDSAVAATGTVLGSTGATATGVLTYRIRAHNAYLKKLKAQTHGTGFHRGIAAGKQASEESVLRGLRLGRRAAYPLTLAGAALAAGHKVDKSDSKARNDASTAFAGGSAAAGVGHGVPKVLDRFSRRYAASSKEHILAAQRIAPHLGGLEVKNGKQTINPVKSNEDIDHSQAYRGARGGPRLAHTAGSHRGIAAQERHFVEAFDDTGKIFRRLRSPGLAVAGVGAVGLARTKKDKVGKRSSVAITGTSEEHKALIGQYGDKGPLPKGLDRDTKMRAYEARYVHAGGDKSEKWNRRANASEGARNASLAVGTGALAGLAALKHRRAAPLLAKHPRLTHRLDAAALTAGAVGGAAELHGEYARHRRASYANSPGGVARSALTRLRAYTPDSETS